MTNEVKNHDTSFEKFRYCTECVVELRGDCSKEQVQAAMERLAAEEGACDSLVVIGAPSKRGGGQHLAKVHCHCNNPTKIFQTCEEFSATTGAANARAVGSGLFREKVDDMNKRVPCILLLSRSLCAPRSCPSSERRRLLLFPPCTTDPNPIRS